MSLVQSVHEDINSDNLVYLYGLFNDDVSK